MNHVTVPLVTVGLPVYNEARFIDATLTSLRQQDYPNMEIVISDNASTDGTVAICEKHANQDRRIRIERNAVNAGATANFQHVLDQARGSYFMWAGGHDLWTANLVSACIKLLETDDSARLAFANSAWIGLDGRPLDRPSGGSDTRGLAPIARFFTVFWGSMHPVMGVMRTDQLRACRPLGNFAGADLALLAELALQGDFVNASDACWSRRDVRAESSHGDKLRRYAMTDTGITTSWLGRRFPLLTLPLKLVCVVWTTRLSVMERLAVVVSMIATLPVRYLVGKQSRTGR